MKKLQYLNSHLVEAFAAGKAAWVVEKLGNILGRKLGTSINTATIPINYENEYGSFAGYYLASKSGVVIKINFLLTKSDSIYSFDVYEKIDQTPDYTVDTAGLNIIQIVNLLLENLIDDDVVDSEILDEDYIDSKKKTIKERGRPSIGEVESFLSGIERWVEEDEKILNVLTSKQLTDGFSKHFIKWASDKPRYAEIKYYMFVKIIKRFLLERGLTNKTFRKRKKGSLERQIEDPILQSQLEDIAEGISWQEKFEFLRGMITQLYNGKIQSIYLYGMPGSGKSYETIQTLDNLGATYSTFSGAGGPDEFVQILYNHREDEILVLDDFSDKLLKNQEMVNILKAALQNDPVRTITYAKVPKKGLDFPPQFKFSSGIIFISNYAKLDPAIASRSMVLEITFSNEEVIEKITSTLKNYRPDVPMAKKQEALEYARELAPGVKVIDYRMIDNIIVAMDISPDNWKRMSLLLLQGIS